MRPGDRGRGAEVVELSSEGEGEEECSRRGNIEVIDLDNKEPAARPVAANKKKQIAITIEDNPAVNIPNCSTKITIEIGDSNEIENRSTLKHCLTPSVPESSRNKIRRVELNSAPKEPSGEFSTKYEAFMNLCLKLDGSDDMKKVLEAKVKKYYRKAEKKYVNSEEFETFLDQKLKLLLCDEANMWKYIKDVVDHLKGWKQEKGANIETDAASLADDPEKRRNILSLERLMCQLQQEIQQLEEQEVDFDREEDSAYLLTEKVKARLVRVHLQYCALTGGQATRHSRVKIARHEGRPPGPAARLERWINRPVASGKPPPFPDFHDVVQCVRDANDKDGLMWTDTRIMSEARELFIQCGRALQKRRQQREWRIASSRLTSDLDPADDDPVLKATLASNGVIARRREAQLIDRFANLQSFPLGNKNQESNNNIEVSTSGNLECDKTASEAPHGNYNCVSDNKKSDDTDIKEKDSSTKMKENINLEDTETKASKEVENTDIKNISTIQAENNNVDHIEMNENYTRHETLDKSEVKTVTGCKRGNIEFLKVTENDNSNGYEIIISDCSDTEDNNLEDGVDDLNLLSKVREEIVILSDVEDSDDDNRSDMDLLREIEMKGEYSTNVFGLESEEEYEKVDLSDISDGSDCVLVNSDSDSDTSEESSEDSSI